MLAALKEEYAGRIVFISLTVEPEDSAEKISQRFPAELHYARASIDAWTSLLRMGGKQQSVVPTHALIESDGSVAEVLEGSNRLEDSVANLAR